MNTEIDKVNDKKSIRASKLCYDPRFKDIFLEEKKIIIQMVYDITSFNKFISFEDAIKDYKIEYYELDGEISKSNVIIEVNNTYYIGIELNYDKENMFPYQISSPFYKICSNILDSGATDREISRKKIIQLNIDAFHNSNDKELQELVLMEENTRKIVDDTITFFNLDIIKCYDEAYRNVEAAHKLPKEVRWGAILYSDIHDIDSISKILGDDLLDKKLKKKFISRIEKASI